MVWQAELSSPTVQVRKDLSLVIIRGSWFISGLMIQQALDKGHMFHTLSLTLDTFHNFLNFKVFICKTITKIFSCFMTLIILDMICTLTDLALSSLLICSHYYLHHYYQFLLVGWDICHTGLVKEMNAESGQREKVTHGNRSGSEYSKKSSEGIIRLQAGVCDSAGACIQKVPEQKHQGHTGGSWYCAHSWHSTTSFLSINEKENQSWEGTLLTCCPASEQQLQADGAAAAVLRSLGSLGEWASGKANGEEAVMGAQDGRLHCTA